MYVLCGRELDIPGGHQRLSGSMPQLLARTARRVRIRLLRLSSRNVRAGGGSGCVLAVPKRQAFTQRDDALLGVYG